MWKKKEIFKVKDQHSQSIYILFISIEGCIVLLQFGNLISVLRQDVKFYFFLNLDTTFC